MCAPIPSRHTHAIKVNTTCRRRVRITQNFIGLLLLSYLMVFFSSSRSAHFQACIRSAFVRRVSMICAFQLFFSHAFPRRVFDFLSKTLNFSVLFVSLSSKFKSARLFRRETRALFLATLSRSSRRRLKKDAPKKVSFFR